MMDCFKTNRKWKAHKS